MADQQQRIDKDNFTKLMKAFYTGFVFDVKLDQVQKSDIMNGLENLKFVFEKKANQEKGSSFPLEKLFEGKLIRNSEWQLW